MITLKDFRDTVNAARVQYTCFYSDCDFETVTQADEKTLDNWEECGAIVTLVDCIDDVLQVECLITMQE